MVTKIIPKASLWIGNNSTIFDSLIVYLQSIYCDSRCTTCNTCLQIASKQFYAIEWIQKEGQYKIEDFDNLFKTILYERAMEVPFIFVIPQSEYLSAACGNRLLKFIEDDRQQYHFLFIAENEKLVMETIVSRCFLYKTLQKSVVLHDIKVPFFARTVPSLAIFNNFVETYKNLGEAGLNTLLNDLLDFWSKQYCLMNDKKQKNDALARVTIIKKIIAQGFSHGTYIFFLRTLYLYWVLMDIQYGNSST